MYTFGEAWFLTTLILNKDWSSLQQVIATGDVINHAIFTKDEVNVALSRFLALNFVEMDNSKNMRATSKAFELCNKSFQAAGLFSQVEIMLKQLKKSANIDYIETIEYFSKDEMQQAYNKYHGMLKR